ncbi:hypothetical protein LPJ73_007282, partial [Coemansia sp. RSA 2703]
QKEQQAAEGASLSSEDADVSNEPEDMNEQEDMDELDDLERELNAMNLAGSEAPKAKESTDVASQDIVDRMARLGLASNDKVCVSHAGIAA